MIFIPFNERYSDVVLALYQAVFAESEGEAEGNAIRALVETLINTTPKNDLIGYLAVADDDRLLGAIFFSRLILSTGQTSFLLSPVAVASDCQGQGVGQGLISHGLAQLRLNNVALVFTYGDPAFYSKLGFQPVSEQAVPPPFKLTQPVGWQGLCLDESENGGKTVIKTLDAPIVCVDAFNVPALW